MKDKNLKGKIVSEGTQLTYLIGSDLTFGSGDKRTPIVLVQDHFWVSLSLMSLLNIFIFLTNSLTLGVSFLEINWEIIEFFLFLYNSILFFVDKNSSFSLNNNIFFNLSKSSFKTINAVIRNIQIVFLI